MQFTLQQLTNAGLPATSTDGNGSLAITEWSRSLTDAEYLTYLGIADPTLAVQMSAGAAAAAVPDWATKTEAWILQWLLDNIKTPLDVPIPPNPMTAAQIRAVLVSMVAILNNIYLAQKASARMIIAMRNKTWPNLQE